MTVATRQGAWHPGRIPVRLTGSRPLWYTVKIRWSVLITSASMMAARFVIVFVETSAVTYDRLRRMNVPVRVVPGLSLLNGITLAMMSVIV